MIKSKITVLNTGGTFNKRYNPLKGELEVPTDNIALDEIIQNCFNVDFEIINIISKDSLEIIDEDRDILVETIKKLENENIIVVHGTDTIDVTAKYLNNRIENKKIVLEYFPNTKTIDTTDIDLEQTINVIINDNNFLKDM